MFTLLSGWASVVPAHAGDRAPLVGTASPASPTRPSVARGVGGQIVLIDTSLVACMDTVTFSEVDGGGGAGTNYDGILSSGGVQFAERFAGQSLSFDNEFDVVSGLPSNPLQPQVGAEGQNLDVFDYDGNALTGLGPIGYPDGDAIGEGSIAILFPAVQSRVKLSLVGGNGGSAALSFYRRNGSLIDEVVVSDLSDLSYAFGTSDDSYIIAGILVQNTDASGIGVDNICWDSAPTTARRVTWGSLKMRYR